MDPEKAKKLLELTARYASAARSAEARRGASYHARDDKRTEIPQEETARFSGEKGKMDA